MKRTSARGVIEHNGKYLLVRLFVAESFWCLPGGGVEEGEDLIAALKRELHEELGVEPEVGNLLFVHQLTTDDGTVESTSFFFHIKNATDYLDIDLAKTTHGQKEIIELGFKDVSSTHLLPRFLKSELSELRKSNYSLPTRIRISTFEDRT
mgnify:CR=1 FL=1